MTSKTVTGLYDNYDDAVRTVREIEAAGVPHSSPAGASGLAAMGQKEVIITPFPEAGVVIAAMPVTAALQCSVK